MLDFQDFLRIIHPALAVTVVFPLLGIVLYMAFQTRQRRLQIASDDGKSKIPLLVGAEHVRLGRWLSCAVVGLALIGIIRPIFFKMVTAQTWTKEPLRFFFVVAMLVATIACLVILYNAKPKLWRGVFATLTGMGVILLGSQPEVFRRAEISQVFDQFVKGDPAFSTNFREMILSHYYLGITVTMLMIFSLAIIQDIYQDRKNRWRTVHIVLNSIAVLFFISQGLTGSRDLIEIPLGWQESYLGQCDWANKTCPQNAPK